MTTIDDPPPATGPTEARTESAVALAGRIVHEVERAVIGKRDVVDLVLASVLAGGHVLLEDVPGVAKTLLARSMATACGLGFSRIQFTPDVLPSDITGSLVLDLGTRAPTFRPGPVFTDVLLADEVNRAPAKSQAALLEAMQEGQVTVDGTPHRLGRPFAVIATQNPIEAEGTYPLPEAQLDRFLFKIDVPFPGEAELLQILERTTGNRDHQAKPVLSAPDLLAILSHAPSSPSTLGRRSETHHGGPAIRQGETAPTTFAGPSQSSAPPGANPAGEEAAGAHYSEPRPSKAGCSSPALAESLEVA